MIAGILEWIAHRSVQAMQKRAQADNKTGSKLRALMTIAFADIDPRPKDLSEEEQELMICLQEQFMKAIFTAASENPDLLLPVRHVLQNLGAALLAEPRGEDQLLLWISCEGLLFWRMMGVIEVTDPLFVKAVNLLRKRLKELAKNSDSLEGEKK